MERNSDINIDSVRSLSTEDIFAGVPGGFFIYEAEGNETVIYVNDEVLHLYGCSTREQFVKLTGNSFKGMVHPEDIDEVEKSIADQIAGNQRKMDYVEYRIVRKDGEVRWVEDFGHLVDDSSYGKIFYVFVSDVTEKHRRSVEKEKTYIERITEQELIQKSLQITLYVYKEIYLIDLDDDYFRMIYPGDTEVHIKGKYSDIIENRILSGRIGSENPEKIRKLLKIESIKSALMNQDSVEYRYTRKQDGDEDALERCSTVIAVSTRDNGVPQSVVMGIRSIENIVRREEKQNAILENALLKAERANDAKTTFLANISHDIRTPMNAIMGFTELAFRHIDERDRVYDCLDKIRASSNVLLELIDEILDMSRIESGRLDIDRTECSLTHIMNNIEQMLSKKIADRNISYTVDMGSVRNFDIYCDELRLSQVLMNVIGNAVKFTEPGGSVGITVTQTASLGKGIAQYEFRVKDTGIGIAPEFMDKLFIPFERERTSTVSKIKGTGLGLAITKNIVDLMNGTIDVYSKVGEGTEFVIGLPFQIMSSEELSAQGEDDGRTETSGAVDSYLEGKRILLVEDNELNREIAKSLLEESGLCVDEAEDGDVVVDMLHKADKPYDCIVMDIQMPHMNGYRTTRAIRELEDEKLSAIPIIGMSANAFEEDKRKSLAMGMNAHLAKPIDIDMVLKTIRKFV